MPLGLVDGKGRRDRQPPHYWEQTGASGGAAAFSSVPALAARQGSCLMGSFLPKCCKLSLMQHYYLLEHLLGWAAARAGTPGVENWPLSLRPLLLWIPVSKVDKQLLRICQAEVWSIQGADALQSWVFGGWRKVRLQ